jgi:uroporphyrinogen-III synthase
MMARTVGALAGRRVAVTRAAAQAGDLLALLRERGAEPLACATIVVQPPESYAQLDAALRALDRYEWVAFTSANAVTAFADRLTVLGVRVPATLRLAAVGLATARVLSERLRGPDFVPRTALAQALGSELADVNGRRVLFPRGDLASDALVSALRGRGAVVDEVLAYRTVAGDGAADLARLVREGSVDAILFMSASSVRQLLAALKPPAESAPLGPLPAAVICIGPETARAAAEGGLEVSAVAAEKTASGIVDAVEGWFGRGRDGDVEKR